MLIRFTIMFSLCLGISLFGFESGSLVLIASITNHCLPFTFDCQSGFRNFKLFENYGLTHEIRPEARTDNRKGSVFV